MKKSAIFLIPILYALFFSSSSSFSQSRQLAPTIPSANAQNLGLFGEIPVSLNSGLPSVSIPVYQINAKGITVPISLDYHASGVRQDVHPSWVGLGWSLNAGGAITRVVKGYEDEAYCDRCLYNSMSKAGYYYSSSVNLRPEWKTLTYLRDYRFEDFISDFEPDEFRFTFAGHSGSFFLDQEGKWQVRCDQPVKVVFDRDDLIEPLSNSISPGRVWTSPKTFKKFTIIDEHGVKYVFGNIGSADDSSIEYSDQLILPDHYSSLATTWNLRQIISADGYDVVEFNYVRGPYQSNLYKSINNERRSQFYSSRVFKPDGRLISPVYLSSITYARAGLKLRFESDKSNELDYTAGDYVELFNEYGLSTLSDLASAYSHIPYFNSNPPDKNTLATWQWAFIWLKLNTINVSVNNEKIKTINLKYDNATTERLRLAEVENKPSAETNSAQYYKLGYFEGKLPGYLRTLGDHWGFVNWSEMLSYRDYDPETFYPMKNPATASDALVGTLKSITYPTKGKTIFDYQRHDYSSAINSSRILYDITGTAGGLRIKSIKNIDNNGNEEVKEYFYVKGYDPSLDVAKLPSSGILESEAKYFFKSGLLYDRGGQSFSFDFFSSSPIVPMTSSSSGQHIGYSEVVEKRSDGAYTIQKFTDYNKFPDNPPEGVWNAGLLPHIPYNSTSFERGRLVGKFVYNNAGKPVQSEEYEYTRPDNLSSQQLTNYSVRNILVDWKNNYRDHAEKTSVVRVAYLMYYYPFLIKNVTSKTFISPQYEKAITSVKSFVYNNKGLVSSEKNTNSKGEVLTHEYDYAYSGIPEMMEKNMLDYKSHIISRNGLKEINIQDIEYKEYPGPSNDAGTYYPKNVKQKAKSADPYQTVIQFDNYKDGNVLEQTIKGGTRESFKWGYQSLYPVAKIVNASSSEFYSQNFEENADFDGNVSRVNSRSHTGRYSGFISNSTTDEVVSHSNQYLNITSGKARLYNYSGWVYSEGPSVQLFLFMYRAGETNYFSYVDDVQTNQTGKWVYIQKNFLVPADVTRMRMRIDNNSAGNVWFDDLRIHPADADISTYTYDPLVGMTSSTDNKGQSTIYEYDDFQRLIRVWDHNGYLLKSNDYHYKN